MILSRKLRNHFVEDYKNTSRANRMHHWLLLLGQAKDDNSKYNESSLLDWIIRRQYMPTIMMTAKKIYFLG